MNGINVKTLIAENDKKISNAVIQAQVGATSVVYGEVINIWDDEKPGMVKVKIYGYMESENNEIWARVAVPYANDKAGFYCYPEVGTQVIIAFAYGNSGMPVIIGSLWNNQINTPPDVPNEENTIKKFITKGGNEITFYDEADKTAIEIKTKGKLCVRLDDEKKMVSLSDDDGNNKIELDCENGNIDIDCKTKLSLKIGGKDIITVEKTTVESKADNFKVSAKSTAIDSKSSVDIKGGPVNIKGSAVTVKADAKLEVTSSGICKIKGSLLNLN